MDGVARLALEDPEIRLARAPEPCGSVAGLHDQLVAERGNGLLVEALAPLEVRHWDPYVIQHLSPPTASRTEPTPIGSSIPVASSSAMANFREPCMRSSQMPLHGRAREVSAGAVVATAFASADADCDSGTTLHSRRGRRRRKGAADHRLVRTGQQRRRRRGKRASLAECVVVPWPPASLSWRRVKKPGAPGVTGGKGKEKGTGPFDTHCADAGLHSDNSPARAW